MHTKNCLTCSFCSKAFRGDDGKEKFLKLKDHEKSQLQNHNFEFIDKKYPTIFYLTCYREQWCEARDGEDKEILRRSLRRKKCKNYFSFSKGENLTFPAIIELQKNDDENFKYWFNFWVTNILIIIGIIVTIIYH